MSSAVLPRLSFSSGLGARSEQRLHRVGLAVAGGPHQRGEVVAVDGVGVDALRDEQRRRPRCGLRRRRRSSRSFRADRPRPTSRAAGEQRLEHFPLPVYAAAISGVTPLTAARLTSAPASIIACAIATSFFLRAISSTVSPSRLRALGDAPSASARSTRRRVGIAGGEARSRALTDRSLSAACRRRSQSGPDARRVTTVAGEAARHPESPGGMRTGVLQRTILRATCISREKALP